MTEPTPDNPVPPRRPARPVVDRPVRPDGSRRPVLPRRGIAAGTDTSTDAADTGMSGVGGSGVGGSGVGESGVGAAFDRTASAPDVPTTDAGRERPSASPALPTVPVPSARTPRKAAVRTPVYRPTLLPSCVVIGTAAMAAGVAAFLQPADAALRRVGPAWPAAFIGVGVVLWVAAVLLSLSLRSVGGPRRSD